jgi:hypothetical protein
MRTVHCLLLGAVLLAVGFTGVWAAPPTASIGATPIVEATRPAAMPSAAAVPLDPFARDLLNRLQSPNAAEREAAQKQLVSIAGLLQSPEMLARLQESTADPDLKALLTARISQMKAKDEERRIATLPPISLDVSGANLSQLAAALNEALGTPNRIMGMSGVNRRYTLDVKNRPFWEVFVALSQQQPLSIQSVSSSSGATMGLMSSGTAIQRYTINGPALAYVGSITYQRSLRLQDLNAGDNQWGTTLGSQPLLLVNVTILIDPRVRMSRYAFPTLISAVDDEGNNLAPSRPAGSSFVNSPVGAINQSFSIPAPANLGKSLSLVCETRIIAIASELTGTIEDVENNLNKPVTLGGRTVRVSRFSGQGTISMQVNVTGNSSGANPAPGQPAPNYSIPFTITDSTGRVLWNSTVPGIGTFPMSFGTAGAAGPFKVEFRIPDKTIEIPLRLELKDVALP